MKGVMIILATTALLLLGSSIEAYAAGGDSVGIPAIWWIAPLASIAALIFARVFYSGMIRSDEGTDRMKEIAGYVREGAMAYLFRQYKVVTVIFILLAVIFAVMAKLDFQDPFLPIAFLCGGLFSGLCGYLGMNTATRASSRTAQGASMSLNRGLQVAFRSGAVMGLVVVGFGLLFISCWYLALDKLVYTPANMAEGLIFWGMRIVPAGCTEAQKLTLLTTTMLTFGMGASTQALFARVGGGIYTKAADVGADLVGKVEAGIPEDDPRNPATIADNVGDNVGDVAGMGADLFESYCGAILATCALGATLGARANDIPTAIGYVTAPMIVAGLGTLASILGMFFVRCKESASQRNLLTALFLGTSGSSVLALAAVGALAWMGVITWGIFGSITAGLAVGVFIGQATEYYTSDEYAPTRGIAEEAKTGPATVIIDGLASGMLSSGIPVVTVVVGVLCAFGFAGGFSNLGMGLYGIGFAAVGMLSTLGITLATDAYGPIADNAGGNAEMAGLPHDVRERTDALDALGNTTAATGKGFAIGSAALTAMALFVTFIEVVKSWVGRFAADAAGGAFKVGATTFSVEKAANADITEIATAYDMSFLNPLMLSGLFIGAMLAFVFCAMALKAVGRAAGSMVNEVRRQFKEIPGIMEGSGKPDYARCVDISTRAAQKEMILPSCMAIAAPLLTGLILGVPGVVGLLAGAMSCGFVLACTLNNAGGAWDNAKKYIEKGALGGKRLPDGSRNPTHAAAVIGDTVGDPCKDTSGPSLNILIKLMSMVSIVVAPLVVKFSPAIQSWLNIARP